MRRCHQNSYPFSFPFMFIGFCLCGYRLACMRDRRTWYLVHVMRPLHGCQEKRVHKKFIPSNRSILLIIDLINQPIHKYIYMCVCVCLCVCAYHYISLIFAPIDLVCSVCSLKTVLGPCSYIYIVHIHIWPRLLEQVHHRHCTQSPWHWAPRCGVSVKGGKFSMMKPM